MAATSGTVKPTSIAPGTIAIVPTTRPRTNPYDHRSRRVSHGVKRPSAAMPGAASAAMRSSEATEPIEKDTSA